MASEINVLCAFCATPFQYFHAGHIGLVPPWEQNDNEEYRLISRAAQRWMLDLRVIGFNPDSFKPNKCFITGTGRVDGYERVQVRLGNDPNVLEDAESPSTNLVTLLVYTVDDGELKIPFHSQCLQIFAQALNWVITDSFKGAVSTDIISKEVLYRSLASMYSDTRRFYLNLPYGEIDDCCLRDNWAFKSGYEAFIQNPLNITGLSRYYKAARNGLGRLKDVGSGERVHLMSSVNIAESPFAKLTDVMIEILIFLPYKDIKNFMLSGLTRFRLAHVQSFWKRKFLLDMPWLWDFPDLSGPQDWFRFYRDLNGFSMATVKEDAEEHDLLSIRGVANRRRIWETCVSLAKIYTRHPGGTIPHGTAQKPQNQIEASSFSKSMPTVSSPTPTSFRSLTTYFAKSPEQLRGGGSMTFYFNPARYLTGISIAIHGTEEKLFGNVQSDATVIEIPARTWLQEIAVCSGNSWDRPHTYDPSFISKDSFGIIGLMITFTDGTVASLGYTHRLKRVLRLQPNHLLTGLVGTFGHGRIQRIGLLQCPDDLSIPTVYENASRIDRHFWLTTAPPADLTAVRYETTDWHMKLHKIVENSPMSYILFTPDLCGISSDWNLYGLVAHYTDGTTKCIGYPREPPGRTERLDIDCRNGERIIKVEVAYAVLPQSIKITTNRGRFGFFGNTFHSSRMIYEPTTELDECSLAGIWGTWGWGDDCSHPSALSVLTTGGKDEFEGVQVIPNSRELVKLFDNTAFLAVVSKSD